MIIHFSKLRTLCSKRLSHFLVETKTQISLSIYFILIELVEIGQSIIDNFMLASYSLNSVAAINLVTATRIPFSIFFMGILVIISIEMGEAKGKKNEKLFLIALLRGVLLAIFLAIFYSILLFSLPFLIDIITTQNQEVIKETKLYSWSVMAAPFATLNLVLFKPYFSFNNMTKQITFICVLGIFFNIIFNYIFIFGNFGMPELGILGAGLGTTLGTWISFLIAIILFFKKNKSKYNLQTLMKQLKLKSFIITFKKGCVVGFNGLARASIWTFTTLLIANISTISLAVHSIVGQFSTALFIIPFAIGQVTNMRTSIAFGRKNQLEFDIATYSSIFITSLLTFPFVITLYLIPEDILSLFLKVKTKEDILVFKQCLNVLKWTIFIGIVNPLPYMVSQALISAGKRNIVLIATLISNWLIGMPLGYFLAFPLSLKVEGIWIMILIIRFLPILIIYPYFFKFKINNNK